MNKYLYRLVFNRSLGVIQVVPEIAMDSGGKGPNAGGTHTVTVRALSLALWAMLGFVSMIPTALSQVVADHSAPGNQQATVLGAPGGPQLINVQTPNSQGVSRNTYSQLDVSAAGAIFNNSRTGATTQLAGAVPGNPWLATGTAKIILNEVRGPTSQLNGYLEIAGDRAQLVIANPAGISCSGCGFINASRLTLTTGTPIFNSGGGLDGYRVGAGAIRIDGKGLDATRTDYTGLITRSLQLNGGIWANQLQATLGSNVVSADHAQITATVPTDPAPTFSLDSSALGGMYANKIVLTGNEHGVGMRNAGTLGAQAGELIVTIDGRLENSGSMQAKTDAHVSATGGVANAGMLSASRELTIDTPADADNSGGVLNAQRIQMDAASLKNRGGSVEQTGAQVLALNANTLTNRDGGRIGLSAPTSGGGTGGSTGGTTDSGGTGGSTDGGTGGSPMPLPLPEPLPDGALNIAGTLDNDGGYINSGGGVGLRVANGLDNAGGHLGTKDLTLTQGELGNAGGELSIAGDASLHVDRLANDGGRLEVAGALDIAAQTLSNRSGALNHSGTAPATVQVAGTLDNATGSIATNADTLSLGAGVLFNGDGRIEHAGTGGMTLHASTLNGAGGTIATASALTLNAGQADHRGATLGAVQYAITASGFDNRGGIIAASGTGANRITVAGALDNGDDGTIASNHDLSIAANTFGNAGGTAQAAAGTLAIDATTLNGVGGTLASNGVLTIAGEGTDLRDGTTQAQRIAIDTGTLVTAGGTLTATGTDALAITARTSIDNAAGQIATNGALQVQAGAVNNTSGIISAAGTAPSQVRVGAALDNTAGVLATSGDLVLDAQGIVNHRGTLQSAGALQVSAEGRLENSAQGVIASGGDLALAAPVLDNSNGGTIQHAGNGTLTIDATTLNGQTGTIASNGTLTLVGETTNLRGGTTSAQTIAVATGSLTTAGGTLAASGGDPLTITARAALDNTNGRIGTNGALLVTAGALTNTDGTISASGTGASNVQVTTTFDNTRGALATSGATTLRAGRLVNAAGTVYSAGDLAVTSDGDLINRDAGQVQSGAGLTLTATGVLDNTSGILDAAGAASVTAAQITNTAGQLVSGTAGQPEAALTVTTAGTLANQGGTVGNRGGDVIVQAGSVDNSAEGTLVAQRDLTLTTTAAKNAGGTIYATRTLRYENATGTLNNAGGQFGAGDTAWLNVASVDNTNGGRIQAGTVWLTTPTLDINGGEVAANQLHADLSTLNGVGRLYGAQWLDANFSGDFTYVSGQRFESDGLLDLAVAGTFTNQGTLQTSGDLAVEAANLVNQSAINASNDAGTGLAQLTVTGVLDNQSGASIEGDTVAISATDVTNTGDIVGDLVDIEADTLTNGRDLGTAMAVRNYGEGFIGASQYLDLRIAQSLRNLDAEIFSGGDLSIAGRSAGTRVGLLDNVSGRIQAEGDAYIAAEQLNNRRRVIATETYTLTPEEQAALRYESDWTRVAHVSDAMLASLNTTFKEIVRQRWGHTNGCLVDDSVDSRCRPTGTGTPNDNPTAEIKLVDQYQTGTRLAASGTSAASELVTAGDLVIDTGAQVTNSASRIAAGRNLLINDQSVDPSGPDARINNVAVTGTYTGERTTYGWAHNPDLPVRYDDGNWSSDMADFMTSMVETIAAEGPVLAAGSITAGGGVTILAGDVTNTSVSSGSGLSNFGLADAPAGPGGAGTGGATPGTTVNGSVGPSSTAPQAVGTPENPLPGLVPTDNGMFDTNADPNSPFLVTTAPRFAGNASGSNYLLGLLGIDTHMHKRLGDGYYEQRLVMEQILQLTGRRSLNGDGSGEAQYRELMENAAAEAGRLGLSLGVALTSSQIAALDKDVVWLVEMAVNGQKVLVPVVYLSKATAERMKAEGALIDGDTLVIESSTTVRNDGTLSSDRGTWLSADTLINDGAIRSGGYVGVATVGDAVNRGTVAGRTVVIEAGGSFVNAVQTDGLRTSGGTINAGTGGLQITAAQDVVNQGQIASAGHGIVSAGRDFIQTTTTLNTVAGSVQGPAGSFTTAGSAVISADRDVVNDQGTITAGEHAVIDAGRDAHFTAGTVEAGGSIAVTAGRDIISDTVTTTETVQTDDKKGKSRTITTTVDETVHGTAFRAGGDIAMTAENITLQAATVTSEHGGIGLSATNAVNLTGAQEEHSWTQDTTKTRSGTFSTTKTATHDQVTDSLSVGTVLSGETVQIGAKNVSITNGQIVGTGDVTIAAEESLDIRNGINTHTEEHDKSQKKSGVFATGSGTIGITAGSRKTTQTSDVTETTAAASLIASNNGSVNLFADRIDITGSDVLSETGTTILGNTVNISATEETTQATDTYETRQSGLNVSVKGGFVQAAQGVYYGAKRATEAEDERLQAAQATRAGFAAYDTYTQMQSGQAHAAEAGGINLRIGYGASRTTSEQTYTQTTARGSQVLTNGNLLVAAPNGTVTVTGSDLHGQNVALIADTLTLQSAEEGSRQESNQDSASGEVGVYIGTESIGVYASAAASRGRGDGSSTGHRETHVTANDTLTMEAQRALLQGAQASANRVIGHFGELTITSEQDTESYERTDQSGSGEAMVGIMGGSGSGSYNISKVDSDYKSVNEQSGIAAGGGGYQITVDGATTLNGGALVSTADPSRNNFSTGSLQANDLKNSADYYAFSAGVTVSGSSGGNGSGNLGARPNLGVPQQDDTSSTTRSSISDGTVIIGDGNTGALANVDRTATQLQQSGLKPIFDERRVQETLELGQVAGEVGMRVAGDIASSMRDRAMADLKAAQDSGDKTAEAQAMARVQSWSEGGTNKAVLHGLTGAAIAALGGGNALQGALGAAGAERARQAMANYLVAQGVEFGSAEYNTLMELGSATLGGLFGGGSGASTALAGDQYNRQLHPDEIQFLTAHAGEFADQLYDCGQECTPEQLQAAKNRLIAEAAARVDGVIAERHDYVVDAEAESFINTHPVNFAWGEGFTATPDQYNQFKYFADLLAADRQAFADLTAALGSAGWTQQDFQNAYHDQLNAVADATRGEDGRAVIENFTGDVGMVLGIVRKLREGDQQGASIDVAAAAVPWGIGKVLRPLLPVGEKLVMLNGKLINDTWVSAKGELTWLNPLTNAIEVVPDAARVEVDHILPQAQIVKIKDFDKLPKDIQRELLNDPINLQPMVKPANCSKGCLVEGVDGGWMTWGDQPVSAEYKKYLQDAQDAFREKVEEAIEAYRASQGG